MLSLDVSAQAQELLLRNSAGKSRSAAAALAPPLKQVWLYGHCPQEGSRESPSANGRLWPEMGDEARDLDKSR